MRNFTRINQICLFPVSNPPPSPVTDVNRESSPDYEAHSININVTSPEKCKFKRFSHFLNIIKYFLSFFSQSKGNRTYFLRRWYPWYDLWWHRWHVLASEKLQKPPSGIFTSKIKHFKRKKKWNSNARSKIKRLKLIKYIYFFLSKRVFFIHKTFYFSVSFKTVIYWFLSFLLLIIIIILYGWYVTVYNKEKIQ